MVLSGDGSGGKGGAVLGARFGDETELALRELALEFARKVAPLWGRGDGHGGHVIEALRVAAERLGLEVGPPIPGVAATGIRRAVFERDAYRCRRCCGWVDLQVDHVVPRARGGTNDLANLQTLCGACNSRKGAR